MTTSKLNLNRWRQFAIDVLLVVSFFLIGFFGALGDGAADLDITGI